MYDRMCVCVGGCGCECVCMCVCVNGHKRLCRIDRRISCVRLYTATQYTFSRIGNNIQAYILFPVSLHVYCVAL